MYREFLNLFVGLVIAIFVAHPAFAAVVNYDEAVDGDLPTTRITFNFEDVGTHTISGSTLRSGNFQDPDAFLFVTASGYEIYDFAGSIEATGNSGLGYLAFGDAGLRERFIFDLNTGSQIGHQLINPAGAYAGSFVGLPSVSSITPTTMSWTMSFSVREAMVPVPVPASLPLLIVGLFGLGFFSRRKTTLQPI